MSTADANWPCITPGVRVYAIGDIHGRLDLLHTLMDMIVANENDLPSPRPVLVFLGDYIDRGRESRAVIDFLLHDLPEGFQPLFLRGNHEDIMHRCLDGPELFDVWAANGGLATIQAYGVKVDPSGVYTADGAKSVLSKLVQAVPESHRDFLDRLRLWAKIGDYFFVHAGVRPGIPLRQQAESDYMFIRDEFLRYRGDFGKMIVHGHTPVSEPEILSNRIGIDTGAVFTGRLTALCLEGNARKFLMTRGSKDI